MSFKACGTNRNCNPLFELPKVFPIWSEHKNERNKAAKKLRSSVLDLREDGVAVLRKKLSTAEVVVENVVWFCPLKSISVPTGFEFGPGTSLPMPMLFVHNSDRTISVNEHMTFDHCNCAKVATEAEQSSLLTVKSRRPV